MTALVEGSFPSGSATPGPAAAAMPGSPPPAPTMRGRVGDRRQVTILALVWLLVLFGAVGLVVYGLGPVLQQRQQHKLLVAYRAAIGRAASQSTGLAGVEVSTKAPELGTPVAILEIGRLSLQQAVVEGVAASQTRGGPGHVPGTAAPGQPGNSVVVGRSHAFGKPFADLGRLRKNDPILITTVQGRSVYHVDSVRHVRLHPAAGPDTGAADPRSGNGATLDEIYGRTTDDRITLVTSGSGVPWNTSSAIVVVAKMADTPYASTPQGGRSAVQSGMAADSTGRAPTVLALLLLGLAIAGTVFLYRRLSGVSAYLLTIAPAAAATIIAGETLSRLFPAWA